MEEAAGFLTFIGVLSFIFAIKTDNVNGFIFYTIVAASCLSTAVIFAIP